MREKGDWFNYLEKPGNGLFTGLKILREIVEVELNPMTSNEKKMVGNRKSKLQLLESANEYLKKQFFGNGKICNKAADNYLINKGFKKEDEADFNTLEFGFFSGYEELKNHLEGQGFSINMIEKIFSVSQNYPYSYLTFPHRDVAGKILAIWCVNIFDTSTKYLPMTEENNTNDMPFLLDKAQGTIRDNNEVIITESYMGALNSFNCGFQNTISINGALVNEKIIDTLNKLSVKYYTLALNSDLAGQEATLNIGENILKAENNSKVYVLPIFPDGIKDLDEYLITYGPEGFKDFLTRKIRFQEWKIKSICRKHGLTETENDPLAYDKAKDEISGFIQGQDLDSLIKKALNSISNDIHSISEKIRPSSLESLVKDLKERKSGLLTGFTELDKYIKIRPGSLNVIAAKPKVGKTALMQNMAYNMAKHEKMDGKTVLYISYEEPRADIELGFLSLISDCTELSQLELYIKNENEDNESVNSGKLVFQNIVHSKRLWVLDNNDIHSIEDLLAYLPQFNSKYPIGALFLDYLQLIPTKRSFSGSEKWLKIKYICSQILTIAKKLEIPIITGSQFKRVGNTPPSLEDLRESGDIEQDSAIVLGLHPGKSSENGEELQIHILKNRKGKDNIAGPLYFSKRTKKITDFPRGVKWQRKVKY